MSEPGDTPDDTDSTPKGETKDAPRKGRPNGRRGRPLGPARRRPRDSASVGRRADVSLQNLPTKEMPGEPIVLAREDHSISRKNIDEDALKVMRRLIRHGHYAFLVGGGVRDLLLNKQPKDFDISTDATPDTIRTLFRNSRIIGRRFKINHVYFKGGKIIEVATFRSSSADDEEEVDEEVQTLGADNTFGTPETDAVRRDLTINGLFYDLSTFSVVDYVGGIEDLRTKTIRIIGDPVVRIQEDPVRMIRATRHAARADFEIEKDTYEAICQEKELIKLCPTARVYEEFVREFRGGSSNRAVHLLFDTGLLEYLLPNLWVTLGERPKLAWKRLDTVLNRIDEATRASSSELPASVLFLAITVGNIPASLIEKVSAEPRGEETLEYWTLEPLVHVDSNGDTQSDSVERSLAKLSTRVEKVKRSSRTRSASSRLGNLIALVFEGLTISRKDKERMEQLLYARFLLLTGAEDKVVADISRRSYAADLLLLLQLTEPEGHPQAVVQTLAEKIQAKKRKPVSKARPRNRGRTRRAKPEPGKEPEKESSGEE